MKGPKTSRWVSWGIGSFGLIVITTSALIFSSDLVSWYRVTFKNPLSSFEDIPDSVDGLVFCIENTVSANHKKSILRAKKGIIQKLANTKIPTDVGVVTFANSVEVFPEYKLLTRADDDVVDRVEEFLAIPCEQTKRVDPRRALLEALHMANLSPAQSRAIVFIASCDARIAAETPMSDSAGLELAATEFHVSNYQQTPIYVFGIKVKENSMQDKFFQDLIRFHGAVYLKVTTKE